MRKDLKITIKNEEEIALMRQAGKYLGQVYEEISRVIRPGMSTLELNDIGEDLIRQKGCIPECIDYEGFPAAFCISVNNQVVHGIPHKDHFLDEGDIVSVDTVLSYKGYMADAARTYPVGHVIEPFMQFIEDTRKAFYEGVKFAKAGNVVNDISKAIGAYAKAHHYGVVRELGGHGIGKGMHEDPFVPNYNRIFYKGPVLKQGMAICIEPMLNYGKRQVDFLEDGWTVITRDDSFSCHYENTVLITEGEPEILTLEPHA